MLDTPGGHLHSREHPQGEHPQGHEDWRQFVNIFTYL